MVCKLKIDTTTGKKRCKENILSRIENNNISSNKLPL